MDEQLIDSSVGYIILFIQRSKLRNSSKPKHRLSNNLTDFERRGITDTDRHPKVGMVTIYDASGLLPLQSELAERYV